ncbi:MAG: response regulator transcription factor [Clostridia bacterium]|nr:response regulator transcription factor [Clostridia bacterium]
MKIAICDDEALCRAEMLAMTQEYSEQYTGQHIEFAAFSHAEDLLEAAKKIGGFDAYLLDIVMPFMNGIELGVELRKRGYDGKIIYLTSSEEYAIDSFRAKPFQYILKPFEKSALYATLDEALESVFAQKHRSIIVRTQESNIKLNLDNILWAELNRRTVVYHLNGGKTVESVQIRITFPEAVQELTKDSRFILCGASMVVNLQHITAVENEALIFKNTFRAYLGKKACREIRSIWYDYTFDGEGSK